MSDSTAIEWADSTFNPWIGCTKISPACDHCYAEAHMDTRLGRVRWGAGQLRSRTSTSNWKNPVRWNAEADEFRQCDVCGWRGNRRPRWAVCQACHNGLMQPTRRRVFCASLADVFDNEVDPHWRADLFALIAATPNLDWLLLTKRIGNAKTMMADALSSLPAANRDGFVWMLPNVWLGATAANQGELDRDVSKLLATPASVRFLSIEPMLSEISFEGMFASADIRDGTNMLEMLDWVIAGGESGPNARPSHPDWFRSLRDQCAAADVPFLFKQWGEWTPYERDRRGFDCRFPKEPHVTWWADQGRFVPFAANIGQVGLHRVGKKAAGRFLDGRLHNGFPKANRQ